MTTQHESEPNRVEPSLLCHLGRSVGLAFVVGAVSHLFGEGHLLDDVSAVALALFLLGTGRRQLLVLLSAVLFWLAFPPLCLPTYWFAFAPVAWLWRYGDSKASVTKEALLFAAVSFWLLTPFVRGAITSGSWYLVYAVGVLLFSLQFLAFAHVIRLLRHRPLALAAPAAAITAVAFEWLYSSGLGSFLVLFLPAAGSPLAQLAAWINPFGVSFLLYLVNCCILPGKSPDGGWAWRPPVYGVALGAAASLVGLFLSWSVPDRPLPVTVLLAQPQHALRPLADAIAEREYGWVVLDRLTREALRREGECDLIVWPETCLEMSYWEGDSRMLQLPPAPAARAGGLSMTVQDFGWVQLPEYRAACLVGVALRDPGGSRLYNSACGFTQDGVVRRYDKQKLLWLVERLPGWLDTPWFRKYFLPRLGVSASFHYGAPAPGVFTFQTRDGRTVKAGVSICYELFFDDLPQFRGDGDLDLIVHITNDSLFHRHTAYFQYEVWMAQYRAIQTRSWQLLCNNWSHSSVIDPKGRVRQQLPPGPAVLSTKQP